MDFSPNQAGSDYSKGLCYLTNIEKDLRCMFECLNNSVGSKILFTKSMLKESKDTLKGDFILSLRGDDVLLNNKEKVIDKLKEISYIHKSYIDEHENLILCLNRSVVYTHVLSDVIKHKNNYGMQKENKSYFVVLHKKLLNDLDALRVTLLADNLISFLIGNGAKVFVNDVSEHSKLLFKQANTYICTDRCVKDTIFMSELIKTQVFKSHKRHELSQYFVVTNDSLVINGNRLAESFLHRSKFGKNVGNIKLSYNNETEVIKTSAFISHYFAFHGTDCDIYETNGAVFHISMHGEKHKIIQSGILIEMLDIIDVFPTNVPIQKFIDCQKVNFISKTDVPVEEFIELQEREIKEAMSDKFSSNILKEDIYDKCLRTLVDTAVKFTFLKNVINTPITIDVSRNRKNDGVFIQYNFARLSTLLEKFDLGVEQGHYRPLPLLDEIDFSLLRENEEWDLLIFILSFPNLVREILYSLIQKQMFCVNKIFVMLTKLSRKFSLYYGRIHILSGSQLQLQKVMHARLWLLKGIHQVMCNSFTLLNIKGLKQM